MVSAPRTRKVRTAWKVATAAALALGGSLYVQRGRMAAEFWAARLERLGDERSVVELAKLAHKSDNALVALVRGLAHPEARTRARVACALCEFPRAREALQHACSDDDERVRSQARFALRVMGQAP